MMKAKLVSLLSLSFSLGCFTEDAAAAAGGAAADVDAVVVMVVTAVVEVALL